MYNMYNTTVERALYNNQYYTMDSVPDNVEFEVVTLELEISAYYRFIPGKFFGHPEDCYPDDEEFDIESVTCNGVPFELTDSEIEKFISDIANDLS